MSDTEKVGLMLPTGPYMTRERFSQVTGLPEGIVRGMIEKGHLPSTKIGKHRLVNTALLTKEALEQAYEL
ncbi:MULTISPECIES: hypothetical protein [unclassified Microbulbifer]|uniref:hypothetical protein n=1 Tax=unclassified Microbulbifer TaxID=2619833 RepID=UPI0027E491D8|nr:MULTISPECIES: hypothetical protein [unclassified Microbulbifer]